MSLNWALGTHCTVLVVLDGSFRCCRHCYYPGRVNQHPYPADWKNCALQIHNQLSLSPIALVQSNNVEYNLRRQPGSIWSCDVLNYPSQL